MNAIGRWLSRRAKKIGALLAAGGMAWLLQPGFAAAQQREDVEKAALRGQTIRIDTFFHLARDCTNVGHPVVRINSAPAGGAIAVKREMDFPGFQDDSSRVHCNSKRAPGTVVYYTPKRNFSGRDRFSFELFWTDGDVWTRNVSVDVR